MAGISVGDDECPFHDILKIFEEPAISPVKFDWSLLALWLDTPIELKRRCEMDLLQKQLKHRDVMEKLIVDWRSRNERKATIGYFLQCIPGEWNQVKVFVRQLIINKATCCEDLDTQSQNDVLQSKIVFMSRECTLVSLGMQIEEKSFKRILSKYLNKNIFEKLLKKEIWTLDNYILPERLPYYIKRNVILYRKLGPEFFKEKCSDNFVLEGIERHHLTILAKPELTDVSENQVDLGTDDLTVRFILLDDENDFSEILKLTTNPVHRIKYQNETFYWISTKGSIGVISKYLANEGEEITEQNVVAEKFKEFNSRPSSICSSPGMGKSVLLLSLANHLKEKFNDRFVFYLRLPDLVKHFNSFTNKVDLNQLKEKLATILTNHTVGKYILIEMMNNLDVKFEIFLDGFDEISMGSFKKAQIIIKHLLDSQNIRLHITSRPHMQQELESILGVISFNIAPFSKDDQISFLCGFWKTKEKFSKDKNLSEVAIAVLESLDQINGPENLEKRFMEILLQCFMLGEVYVNVAKRYANQPSESVRISNPTKSLVDLYKKFMENGFERISIEDKEIVKKLLWNESLKLLFPKCPEALQIQQELQNDLLNQENFPHEKIYDVGFLEANENINSVKFVHRSFAEYLLADFIVRELIVNQTFRDDVWTKFVYETILATSTQEIELKRVMEVPFLNFMEGQKFRQRGGNMSLSALKQNSTSCLNRGFGIGTIGHQNDWSFWQAFMLRMFMHENSKRIHDLFDQKFGINVHQNEFCNPLICLFLNAKLAEQQNLSDTTTIFNQALNRELVLQQKKILPLSFLTRILICSSLCYKQVMKLLVKMLKDSININEWGVNTEFYQYFYVTLAQNDNVECFKSCSKIGEVLGAPKFTNLDFKRLRFRESDYQHTVLHEAVQHGNYRLAEYLITMYDDEKVKSMSELWQIGFLQSWTDSSYIIGNKVMLLKLLKSLNVELKLTTLEQNIQPGIHVDLFITLCDILKYKLEEKDVNFLHNFVLNFCKNDIQMDKLVAWFMDKNYTWLLIHLDEEQNCLLTSALCYNVLNVKTKVFNSPPFNLYPVFQEALNESCGEIVAKIISSLSGDVDWADKNNATILHAAAYSKDINAITFVLSEGANVNLRDNHGNTPLHCIFLGINSFYSLSLVPKCIQILVENKANVCLRNKRDESILAFARIFRKNNDIDDTTIDLIRNTIQNDCGSGSVSNEEFEVLKTLLNWEYVFQIYDSRRIYLLQSFIDAMSWNCSEILVKCTIGLTGNVNICDAHQATFLHYAAYFGNLNVMKLLISMGANANLRDLDGDTPLHWVFDWNGRNGSDIGRSLNLRNGWIHDGVQILVDYKANVCVRNNKGDTPLSWALQWKEQMKTEDRIMKLLVETLANIIDLEINNFALQPACEKIEEGSIQNTDKRLESVNVVSEIYDMKRKRYISYKIVGKICCLLKRIYYLISFMNAYSTNSFLLLYVVSLIHFKYSHFARKIVSR